MDVVLLCGGQGTRLRQVVSDRPKSMVTINNRPFLDLLIQYFRTFGIRRFILCTGYKAEIIQSYYSQRYKDIEIIFSHEQTPLGTAGAVKNAEPLIQTDPFLVANGDSFCRVDLVDFLQFHQSRQALLSLVVTQSNNPDDYGSVLLDQEGRIVSFSEKQAGQRKSAVSAGLYLFKQKTLKYIPEQTKVSLEYEIFP